MDIINTYNSKQSNGFFKIDIRKKLNLNNHLKGKEKFRENISCLQKFQKLIVNKSEMLLKLNTILDSYELNINTFIVEMHNFSKDNYILVFQKFNSFNNIKFENDNLKFYFTMSLIKFIYNNLENLCSILDSIKNTKSYFDEFLQNLNYVLNIFFDLLIKALELKKRYNSLKKINLIHLKKLNDLILTYLYIFVIIFSLFEFEHNNSICIFLNVCDKCVELNFKLKSDLIFEFTFYELIIESICLLIKSKGIIENCKLNINKNNFQLINVLIKILYKLFYIEKNSKAINLTEINSINCNIVVNMISKLFIIIGQLISKLLLESKSLINTAFERYDLNKLLMYSFYYFCKEPCIIIFISKIFEILKDNNLILSNVLLKFFNSNIFKQKSFVNTININIIQDIFNCNEYAFNFNELIESSIFCVNFISLNIDLMSISENISIHALINDLSKIINNLDAIIFKRYFSISTVYLINDTITNLMYFYTNDIKYFDKFENIIACYLFFNIDDTAYINTVNNTYAILKLISLIIEETFNKIYKDSLIDYLIQNNVLDYLIINFSSFNDYSKINIITILRIFINYNNNFKNINNFFRLLESKIHSIKNNIDTNIYNIEVDENFNKLVKEFNLVK